MSILQHLVLLVLVFGVPLVGLEANPNSPLRGLFEEEGAESRPARDVRPSGPSPSMRPDSQLPDEDDYRFERRTIPQAVQQSPARGEQVFVRDRSEVPVDPVPTRISPIGVVAPESEEVEEEVAPDPGTLLKEGRLNEVAQIASRNRDGPLAVALAWELFSLNRWEDARTWYIRGIEWGAPQEEPTYGLALTEFQLGNTIAAMGYAREISGDYRRARVFLQDLLSVGATDAFETESYGAVVRFLSELYQYRYLNRGEQLMLAWSYQRTGRHVDAARLFEALYRNSPNQEDADGLNAALVSMGELEYRNQLAEELGGPFRGYIVTEVLPDYTNRLSDRGFVRAAEAKRPDDFPHFRSVGDPAVFAGASFRSKSGETGLGQLSETRLPVVGARVFLLERHMVEVKASRVVLTSGQPDFDADIGTVPVRDPDPEAPPPSSFPRAPTTEASDLELILRYRWEGLLSPYAEIGFPAGGSGSEFPSFRLGMTSHYEDGYVEGEVFGLPVRESILSYTGMVDPFTGNTWGKVREYGGRFSVFHELDEQYSLYGQIEGSYLNGVRVQNNQKLAMRLSGARSFEADGFEFLTVGPGISVANYRRNLSKFTFGHGGYFSPQTFFQVDFGANLLTEGGKSWLLKASGYVGYQTNRQSSVALFPQSPDNRFYPSENAASMVFGLSGQGAVLLSPEWMLGGHLSVASTADYTEFVLGMLVQYTFGHRVGLFESDLDGWDSFW